MSASGPGDADLDSAFERARMLLGFRRPEAAERELRGVLARDPQDFRSRALLALSLSARGAVDEALGEANEAVRLAPGEWFPHYAAAFVLRTAGRTAEALRAVRAAIDLEVSRPSLWELLASIHLRRGEWRLAADAARQGLSHDPDNSDLVSNLALALAAQAGTPRAGRPEAREALTRAGAALRLAPEEPLAHLAYGMASLVNRRPEIAAQAFRETLRIDPGVDLARRQLVTALKHQNPIYRALDRSVHQLRSWPSRASLLALPLVVILPLAGWALWAADTVMTVWLMGDSYARSLLDRDQTMAAVLSAAALGAGAGVLVLAAALTAPGLVGVGVASLVLVSAIQAAYATRSPNGRMLLAGWSAAIAVTLGLACSAAVGAEATDDSGLLGWLMVPAGLLSIVLPGILDRARGD